MVSKNNRGKGRQHINVLLPSSLDNIALCDALDYRFRQLCSMYKKVHGEDLIPPKSLDRDMFLWRTLHARYKNRDRRHTQDEFNAVKRICQWTLDVKCQLAGQERKVMDW